MEKEDARKLSPQAQEQIRKRAVGLKKKGKTIGAIAEIFGVHRNAGSNWWHTYLTRIIHKCARALA